MNDSDRIMNEEDICFVTGNPIPEKDRARFTIEFDAWISEEGQRIVEDAATSRMTASMMTSSQLDKHKEYWIIHREWYAQDAAPTAEEEAEANSANEEFRSWHK